MKSCGVIAEYNPFHNGHAYHLAMARKKSQADVIVAVMSGNFLQRGEPALIDKWTRAEVALKYGADLVIELPTAFAVQSADYFGQGSLMLLQALGVDSLSFGTDQDASLDYQAFAALVAENHAAVEETFQKLKNNGMSYPQQLTEVYRQLFPKWQLDFSSPNHILAMSYAKANQAYPQPLNLFPIKREGTSHHQQEIEHANFASGTAIRQAALRGEYQEVIQVVGPEIVKKLQETALVSWDGAWPLLKYQLLTSTVTELQEIYQMVEGIEYRLLKYVAEAESFNNFLALVKTKRFTWTRLQRLCTYVLLQIKTSDVEAVRENPYLRVLGFNDTGRAFLSQQRKELQLPLITNVARKNEELLQLDIRAGEVYGLLSGSPKSQDYYRQPIYDKNKT